MHSFETSRLWRTSLGDQGNDTLDHDVRSRFRYAFLQFRKNAEVLAGEIARDLPDRTVHDITHLDALWGIADLIAGESVVLTPPEAFVLGGAFLVHDLAMSRAAYPHGLDSLRHEPLWQDTLAGLLKWHLGRAPSLQDIANPSDEVIEKANEETIVALHAQQSEHLTVDAWTSPDGKNQYYLIEDQDLRNCYGPVIGKIAHSHWWSVNEIPIQLPGILNAPGWCRNSWVVDTIKIACLLRLADAAHLDERRSPGFLRLLRKPKGESGHYWRFQENLLQPRLDGDRLVYTVKRPFEISEVAAWWICYDSLQMVSRELQQVDTLLLDLGGSRPRFAARSVAKVDAPERLADLIKTDGWIPIDVRIRVTDVAALAKHLGGDRLYGNDMTIPLRELVQNGFDAVRARRLIDKLPNDWGRILVSYGKEKDENWVEIEDNGLGMSKDVISGPLLDFGTSYWGSQLMRREHPGLLGTGFQSIGKFGVGFFSVFMWGNHVKIITRKYDAARADTYVLEFSAGLTGRPTLRKAQPSECLSDGGTRVRVWLKPNLLDVQKTIVSNLDHWRFPEELCEALFPSAPVTVAVKTIEGAVKTLVSANDWMTIAPEKLMGRIEPRYSLLKLDESQRSLLNNFRPLRDSTGEIVGRGCIGFAASKERARDFGVVTVGGVRSGPLRGFLGILTGTAESVTRYVGIPVVGSDGLARWATEQADLAAKIYTSGSDQANLAEMVRECGGEIGSLSIALRYDGWVSAIDLRNWKHIPDVILLCSDREVLNPSRPKKRVTLNKNVLGIQASRYWFGLQSSGYESVRWPKISKPQTFRHPDFLLGALRQVVIEALANAWKVSLDDVLKCSDLTGDPVNHLQVVGRRGKQDWVTQCDVIKKPLV